MYRGHTYMYLFVHMCTHRCTFWSTILYYGHVAWQFFYNIIAIYIYNINQGSNLYIYMVDLISKHDIMVDLVMEHDICGWSMWHNDMCGSCMCANLNEFPIYLKEEFKWLINFLTSYNSNMYNNIYIP